MKPALRFLLTLFTILCCTTIGSASIQESQEGVVFGKACVLEGETGFWADFNAPKRIPRPKTGDYFEHTINTPKGPVDILADVVVDGNKLILKDISIYGRGKEPLTGLLKSVYKAKTEIFEKAKAKAMGFEQIEIKGLRSPKSSTGKPGPRDIIKNL